MWKKQEFGGREASIDGLVSINLQYTQIITGPQMLYTRLYEYRLSTDQTWAAW